MLTRYRQIALGNFEPQNRKMLSPEDHIAIEIPSPVVHVTREGALKRQNIEYSFRFLNGKIVLFAQEIGGEHTAYADTEVFRDSGGRIIHDYSHDDIKNLLDAIGSSEEELSEMGMGKGPWLGATLDVSFDDLFPNLTVLSKSVPISVYDVDYEEIDLDEYETKV